jgi:hypothetical protein
MDAAPTTAPDVIQAEASASVTAPLARVSLWKSGFQSDSADGLPAGRLRIKQAGSPLAELGTMPDFHAST